MTAQLTLPLGIRQLPQWQRQCCGQLDARCSNCPLKRASAQTLARVTDAGTSHEAAARTVEFSGKHEAAIFCWLKDHPRGGTFHEIGAGTGLESIAVARRIAKLRTTAGVYDSGETRRTPTGRAATVWKVR